jgi:hypothetical protein
VRSLAGVALDEFAVDVLTVPFEIARQIFLNA